MVGRTKTLLGILGIVGALAMPSRAENTEAVVGPLVSNTNITWNWGIESDQQISAGENGGVSGTGSGWYRVGSTVSNDANPDTHYQFNGWSGDVPVGINTNDNPLVYTSDREPRDITANFSPVKYNVTVVSDVDGEIGVGSPTGAGSYDAFTTVTSTVPTVVTNTSNPRIRYVIEGYDTN